MPPRTGGYRVILNTGELGQHIPMVVGLESASFQVQCSVFQIQKHRPLIEYVGFDPDLGIGQCQIDHRFDGTMALGLGGVFDVDLPGVLLADRVGLDGDVFYRVFGQLDNLTGLIASPPTRIPQEPPTQHTAVANVLPVPPDQSKRVPHVGGRQ